MTDYYSVITERGKALEAEVLASGRVIALSGFVVGDGNGKRVKPSPAQTRLVNETYRGSIAELVVSPEQSNQLMAKIVLPADVGGFTVREVGLLTDSGELYAVANCPAIDKPAGGVSVNMQFRLAVSDTSNITLEVATGDGLFLRIDQSLKEIRARGAEAQKASRESIGVVDATTEQKGLVQLNSATDSSSETQAATPAAVKAANDNASGRVPSARKVNNHPLTGDINVTSQDIFNGQVISIGADKNLNEYRTPGLYVQNSDENASLALNYPQPNAGSLVVLKNAGSVTQIYYVYKSSRVWCRGKIRNGKWTKWGMGYNTLNKPSPDDIGVYSKDESDARYQRKGNYTPAGQAYTKVESDGRYYSKARSDDRYQSKGNYITGIRFGASTEYKERRNGERIDGGVMTSWADWGGSNYWVRLRPLQYQINGGTWFTVSYIQGS
ncbi:phage tail protein [Enterobacter cloacae]|uniref:phage tail-collar fiber domain-containing protein n=1 Tax=Enterobacter cloacae TaxID=550 RepID=UPI000B8D6B30|nr:phage tail protein [Enterobacter cloacae]ASQ17395.1 hypothetical protein BJM06_01596 [Enterobacter cloacae]